MRVGFGQGLRIRKESVGNRRPEARGTIDPKLGGAMGPKLGGGGGGGGGGHDGPKAMGAMGLVVDSLPKRATQCVYVAAGAAWQGAGSHTESTGNLGTYKSKWHWESSPQLVPWGIQAIRKARDPALPKSHSHNHLEWLWQWLWQRWGVSCLAGGERGSRS